MKKSVKHAVVLVNYKVAQDTIACIHSIQKSQDAPHIIVVDNGSSAEVIQQLRDAVPGLDLIVAGENIGFSAGNNLGIKKALKLGAQVVYILNNDTLVDPDLFARAFRYVVGKNRISGGKIYYAKGYEFHAAQKGRGDVLWYAGGRLNWGTGIAEHVGVDEIDRGQYDKIRPVEFTTGCFMAVPRAVFTKIGLLHEPFFLYLEDADFCLHARAAGVEVMYNPRLVVYHCNSSSTVAGSPLVDYYLTRNRFYIGRRYGSTRLFLALIKEALTRNWGSPIRRQAFFDYLFGRMGNRNETIAKIVAQAQG